MGRRGGVMTLNSLLPFIFQPSLASALLCFTSPQWGNFLLLSGSPSSSCCLQSALLAAFLRKMGRSLCLLSPSHVVSREALQSFPEGSSPVVRDGPAHSWGHSSSPPWAVLLLRTHHYPSVTIWTLCIPCPSSPLRHEL